MSRPIRPALSARNSKSALALCMFAGVTAASLWGCIDRPLALQQPITSRQSVKTLPNASIEKIDLLFMIDNSVSMADKQLILAEAVPDLLSRLTRPDCVSFDTGDRINGKTVVDCPAGYHREFKAVEDIHIGVVSSSLEMPGSETCEKQADVGLVTRKPGEEGPGADINGKRFIEWDPSHPDQSTEMFKDLVRGVGESGCGYEASLESWYRFLVDPNPPSTWLPEPCWEGDDEIRCRVPGPVDTKILEQRKAFLRPDSLLAIIMLTDENDCSINPIGQGWYASSDTTVISRGTAACDTDPDSDECMNCGDLRLEGEHPECAIPPEIVESQFTRNLRCWDQKRRFGRDFMYPIERYVRGLTETHIDGVLNPIFCPELDPSDPTGQTCKTALRPRDFVFLGGIVGVPWQDIANNPQNLGDRYRSSDQFGMTASQLEANELSVPGGVDETRTLWDVVLGPTHENHAQVASEGPFDPLMRESVKPREGTNPALGVELARPDVTDPMANPINGHEWNAGLDAQLQFSCIFDLPQPFECDKWQCDCESPEGKNNPLCQDAQGGYSTTQRRAKAYPGLRQLAVLKGIGEQGIAASICPATMDDSRPDYGYRPAVSAIVDRLSEALSGTCWDEELEPDDVGNVPCVVLEATRGEVDNDGNATCDPCEGIRSDPSPASWAAVSTQALFKENKMNCLCEVAQAPSDSGALRACIEQNEVDPANEGWCYVDPETDELANRDALGSCRRMIRFVGDPRPNSLTFIQCRGASF
jgi:hypothetical protein